MISDLARWWTQLPRKEHPRDILIEVLESAMIAAGRKRFGMERDLEAQFNEDLGEVEFFEFVPWSMLSTTTRPRSASTWRASRTPSASRRLSRHQGRCRDLGRIAAQTAKQVIIQKIRDAEREMTFNEFKDRKGERHYRYRASIEATSLWTWAGRRPSFRSARVQAGPRQGDRIQAYVLDITRASRSPQVVLSRTHPGLLMKLFEPRFPRSARASSGRGVRPRAGHRAKIAVGMDRDVDPVGACVGLKGCAFRRSFTTSR